jgi:hypothetical protein
MDFFFSCTVFVLSGRGLCDGPIPRPEESYRLWSVSDCDQVKINPRHLLWTGRRGKDYKQTMPIKWRFDDLSHLLSTAPDWTVSKLTSHCASKSLIHHERQSVLSWLSVDRDLHSAKEWQPVTSFSLEPKMCKYGGRGLSEITISWRINFVLKPYNDFCYFTGSLPSGGHLCRAEGVCDITPGNKRHGRLSISEQKCLSLHKINSSDMTNIVWKIIRTAVQLYLNCIYYSWKYITAKICTANRFSDETS